MKLLWNHLYCIKCYIKIAVLNVFPRITFSREWTDKNAQDAHFQKLHRVWERLIIQQGDWSHGLIKYEGFWPGGGDPECEISVRSGSHQTGRSLTFRRPRGTETSALLKPWASFHWFHLWNTTGDVCFPSCSPRACEDHSPCVTRACETSTFVFDRRNKEGPQWSVCCWWLLMRFLSILQLFMGQSCGEETECLWDVIASSAEVSPSLILDWKSKTYSCRTASTLILVYFILILRSP